MSDYGYRPAPPPEDGRPQGHGAGQPDGRAYGNAPGGSGGGQGGPDYGWGGGSQQQGGGHGQAPRPRQQPYGTPSSGQAPVGRGSASVGRPTGAAPVGRPHGSASVGGATGSASVGGAGRTGRASVGSASVGSASVGSASVGSARPGDFDSEKTGRASVTGTRRAGKGPLNKGDLEAEGGKKKRKRFGRKMLAAMIALGILFIAGVTIVGSYFFVNVEDPGDISRAGESSSFYFSDGSQAGGYGETLRLQAEDKEIPDLVKDALVATEDRKFYKHSGVDFTRTMGALVNNLKGGDMQGASTITQQYAGLVMEIRDDISYDRKAREAAMAIKMEQDYSKDQIISAYLNLAWYGRGATGIEAAAEVYFNKELKDLTAAEAAYIIMQVKSPDGTYDPYYGEGNGDMFDPEATQARWDYSMDAMVEEGYLSQADRDAAEMPVPTDKFNSAGSWGGNTNIGFIINELDGYVFEELKERYGLTKKDLYGSKDDEDGGGYSVNLTIDPTIQNQLASTGSRGEIAVDTNEAGEFLNEAGEVVPTREEAKKDLTSEGYAQFEDTNEEAALEKYEEYMMTAMVAIDPKTGNIVGYYGGDNGFGVDKAGPESPHPSSSTFKMITAATAIAEGDSIDSWFNADSPRKFDSLTNEEEETCIGGGDYPDCTLRNGSQQKDLELTLTDAVRDSKNTPMYSIAEHYDASTILDYADKMGLSFMNQARPLTDSEGKTWDSRSINYKFYDDGTYSQHGQAVDAAGKSVVDGSGNWDTMAPVQVDDNCNPIVNTEGVFIQTEDELPVKCEIGKKGTTDPFYNHIAFGQYPTSVRDMASVYATIANDGVYNESHFVASVTNNKGEEVAEIDPLTLNEPVIDSTVARDLQWIGSEIGGESETDQLPRDYFGKTGTWEATCEDCESSWNAHAWYVGAIPQLSIAAWVGNVTSESDPIADPDGNKSNVFGSNTAYPVWFDAMEGILEATGWDKESWEGKANAGNETWWDIEQEGANEGGQFCAAKPENALCASQQEEDEDATCDDDGNNGGGNDNEDCETTPGDDVTPTTDPTEDESGGEECGLFPTPECEEGGTTPEEEASTTPEENGNGNG